MEHNITTAERIPRLVIALASAVGALYARGYVVKGLLLGTAAATLATVAAGYCPINAVLKQRDGDQPEWRTLKTYRVEA